MISRSRGGAACHITRHSLGYATSVHYVNGTVEMHAVLLTEPHTQHVAWSSDGDGPDDAYLVACGLAAMVGSKLDVG